MHFDSGLNSLEGRHLYNPMSTNGAWVARVNNLSPKVFGNSVPQFNNTSPRLGRAGNSDFFFGEILELILYDRALSDAEREAVSERYLRYRYNLW